MQKAANLYTARTLPSIRHGLVSLIFDVELSSISHDIPTSFYLYSQSCFSSLTFAFSDGFTFIL